MSSTVMWRTNNAIMSSNVVNYNIGTGSDLIYVAWNCPKGYRLIHTDNLLARCTCGNKFFVCHSRINY